MKDIEWERELAGAPYDGGLFWSHACAREKGIVHTGVREECSLCGAKEQRDEKGRPMTCWGGVK